MLKFKENNTSYLLILQLTDTKIEQSVIELIKKNVHKHHIRSKSINPGGIEIIFEVRFKGDNSTFVNKINELTGIDKVTLITSNEDLATF